MRLLKLYHYSALTYIFLHLMYSETEASITATERVDAMSRVPQEQSMHTSTNHHPPRSWPTAGNLVFDEVHLRYRKSLPLALNGLSFNISAASKVGVVGRTGAGRCFGIFPFNIISEMMILNLIFSSRCRDQGRVH